MGFIVPKMTALNPAGFVCQNLSEYTPYSVVSINSQMKEKKNVNVTNGPKPKNKSQKTSPWYIGTAVSY